MTRAADDDAFLAMAGPYALGALDAGERPAFEEHLPGCDACREAVDAAGRTLPGLASALSPLTPREAVRSQLLDLARAPRWPFDLSALAWEELAPGIRVHVVAEEPERGLRKCLVWADPGARMGTHRHGGDECILVLKGGLKDERGEYHAGELCRSREGSVHHEEVLPGDDCVCYVVYYGPLEFL
jgi:anti-sigma factor ChrR (cupin superfamily)